MPSVTFGGTISQDATVGTLAWSNASNAASSDNTYANVTIQGSSSEITRYLTMTGSNGLPTPSPGYYNNIDGIEIFIEGYSEAGGALTGSATSYSAKLLSSSALAGNDLGLGAIVLTKRSNDLTYSIGSSIETWGLSQIQLELVNGFAIAFYDTGLKEAYLKIDRLYATISYTETLLPSNDSQLLKKRASFFNFLEDD